jgi:hypothetical protein
MSERRIAVYTTIRVLMNMRDRLGLEAMCSFMERYADLMEHEAPGIRRIVASGLEEKALQGLYEKAAQRKG